MEYKEYVKAPTRKFKELGNNPVCIAVIRSTLCWVTSHSVLKDIESRFLPPSVWPRFPLHGSISQRVMLHVYSWRCSPISFAGWAPSLHPMVHWRFHYLLRQKLAALILKHLGLIKHESIAGPATSPPRGACSRDTKSPLAKRSGGRATVPTGGSSRELFHRPGGRGRSMMNHAAKQMKGSLASQNSHHSMFEALNPNLRFIMPMFTGYPHFPARFPTLSRKMAKDGKAHIKSLGSGVSVVAVATLAESLKPSESRKDSRGDGSLFGAGTGTSSWSISALRNKPPKAKGMGEPGQGQTKQFQDNSGDNSGTGFQKKRSALFKNIYLSICVYIYICIYICSAYSSPTENSPGTSRACQHREGREGRQAFSIQRLPRHGTWHARRRWGRGTAGEEQRPTEQRHQGHQDPPAACHAAGWFCSACFWRSCCGDWLLVCYCRYPEWLLVVQDLSWMPVWENHLRPHVHLYSWPFPMGLPSFRLLLIA